LPAVVALQNFVVLMEVEGVPVVQTVALVVASPDA